MKRFLIKLFLFLLPLLAGLAFVEVRLAQMPNTYSQKRAGLEGRLNEIQVLVLGPSHALHGIDPARFGHKGYNVANASQTLYYDKAITLKYLDQMPALRLVIIPISYNSLFTRLSDSRESFRGYFYNRYWGISSPGTAGLDLRKYSYIALYTPQKAWDFLTKGFRVDLTDGLEPNGYLPYDTVGNKENISLLLGAKRVELYRRMMKEECYSENMALLTDMVTKLRNRNVQVCFVTTPVFKTFAQYCEPSVLANNAESIRDLCREYGCGYMDYFNDSRFSIRDFYDNDHLNARGAAKLSTILNIEVVSKVPF